MDCGMEIYDSSDQDTHAGCGLRLSALVLARCVDIAKYPGGHLEKGSL